MSNLSDEKFFFQDDYPIILYDPDLNSESKKSFQDLFEKDHSIHLFSNPEDAFTFAFQLKISFVMIAPIDFEEAESTKGLQEIKSIFHRRMFDFEEEAFLQDLFKEVSDEKIKSLNLKVSVFMTILDCITSVGKKKDEEEVILMCDIQEMVNRFRQDFTIIWFNPWMNAENKAKLEEEIEMNIEENNIYANFEELLVRIKNYTGPPYHLVFEGETKARTEEIIQEIENLKDLLGLYIVDSADLQTQKSEKIDVGKTLEELIPQIKKGIRTRSKLKNTFPAFATDFDSSDRSGIYKLHYYLKGLIKFANRKQAKEDFIKLARKIYQDQKKELARFEEEYNDYNRAEILWWYTKESPIYRLINNCLRISSSDSILYCRLILGDLERAIREQYQEQSKDFNGVVFRGTYISTEEWEKLERNLGKEIEMYGFLSTTLDRKIAVNFLKADPQNKILTLFASKKYFLRKSSGFKIQTF